MNIIVCSKISFPSTGKTLPDWSHAQELGHDVTVVDIPLTLLEKPDALICMSVSSMTTALTLADRWPTVPLFCYHWDCYSWVWLRPRPGEYDYHVYGGMLKRAREVWVPSDCTSQQASLWWNLPRVCTIWPACPTFDHPNIISGDYVLCALRDVPDLSQDWARAACSELDIPFKEPNHGCSLQEYRDLIAGCRLIINHYHEASTGGLSILEAYYLGKPVLLTDSPWNGAQEYFLDRARYFRHESFGSCKEAIRQDYNKPPAIHGDHAEWVSQNFNDRKMVTNILDRIYANA